MPFSHILRTKIFQKRDTSLVISIEADIALQRGVERRDERGLDADMMLLEDIRRIVVKVRIHLLAMGTVLELLYNLKRHHELVEQTRVRSHR